MRRHCLALGASGALITLLLTCPARAQHHAGASQAQAATGHVSDEGNAAAMPQMSAAYQRQIQQEFQQAVRQGGSLRFGPGKERAAGCRSDVLDFGRQRAAGGCSDDVAFGDQLAATASHADERGVAQFAATAAESDDCGSVI